MSEIEFRLPSKVPYGYVNVRFNTPETEAPDPQFLAAMYASYVMAFAEQERESLNAYGKPAQAKQAPSEAAPEAAMTKEEAEKLIKQELGGVVVSEETHEKPWENEAPAVKKPWEGGGTAVKPAEIDW